MYGKSWLFLTLIVVLLTSWTFFSVRADGGAEATSTPQPEITLASGAVVTTTPVNTPTQGSISSFMIEVGPGKTPTILAVTPSGTQLAILGEQAAQPGSAGQTSPEKFQFPIWLCAFMAIVLVIVALNSFRKRVRD